MPIEAIVILILAVLGIIAGVIFMFLKSHYPPFKSYHNITLTYDSVSTKVHTWAENDNLLRLIDDMTVAKAVLSLKLAWKHFNMPENDKIMTLLGEVAVLGTTDQTFPKYAYYSSGVVSSVQVWTKDKFYSKRIPMFVLPASVLEKRPDAESAYAIHEYIHAMLEIAFNDADHKHLRAQDWKQLTTKAHEIYATL